MPYQALSRESQEVPTIVAVRYLVNFGNGLLVYYNGQLTLRFSYRPLRHQARHAEADVLRVI
jgi:hypothetical protein